MNTTILLVVSRPDFLSEVISAIELLECDETRTNILCIVNGDLQLYTRVRNIVQGMKFSERLTVHYPGKPPTRFDVPTRRRNITDIHNFARQYVGNSQYVFSIEDDTIVPRHALKSLMRIFVEYPACAFAEGVELGRWNLPYVGAWMTDNIYDPQSISSVEMVPLELGKHLIDRIDAGGLYCALIKGDLYRSHTFDLYDDLGPDINLGITLRQQGYENFIDWNVHCTHLTIDHKKRTQRILPNDGSMVITLVKKHNKEWAITT